MSVSPFLFQNIVERIEVDVEKFGDLVEEFVRRHAFGLKNTDRRGDVSGLDEPSFRMIFKGKQQVFPPLGAVDQNADTKATHLSRAYQNSAFAESP